MVNVCDPGFTNEHIYVFCKMRMATLKRDLVRKGFLLSWLEMEMVGRSRSRAVDCSADLEWVLSCLRFEHPVSLWRIPVGRDRYLGTVGGSREAGSGSDRRAPLFLEEVCQPAFRDFRCGTVRSLVCSPDGHTRTVTLGQFTWESSSALPAF